MDVIVTVVVLVGVVMAIGAGLFARFVAPAELPVEVLDTLRAGLALGGAIFIGGSVAEVVVTVDRMLRGPFELGFAAEYVVATRHGRSVLAGILVMVALLAWGAERRRSPYDRSMHAALSVTLLATMAWVSHSGTMGVLPLLGDLGHLVAATGWAGALAYLAWSPVWGHASLPLMVERVSAIGLAAVAVLVGTGTYMAVLHVYGLEALTTTAYGVSLVVKVSLIALVLALAAVNRWWLVPLLEARRTRPLLIAVRVETVLLALVLVATAVLVTREPAHAHPDHPEHDHGRVTGAGPVASTRPAEHLRPVRRIPTDAQMDVAGVHDVGAVTVAAEPSAHDVLG